MEIESLFGLPAHPLLVHASVVLVPLAAIGTVLIAVSARLRRRLGVTVAVLAVVAFGFTYLSKESGQALEEQVDETHAVQEHAELGEAMPLFAGLLVLGALGVVGLDEYGRRAGAAGSTDGADGSTGTDVAWLRPVTIAVAVLAVAASVAATVQVAEVGHSGAKATWEGRTEGGEHEGGSTADHDDDGDEEGLAPAASVASGPSVARPG